MPNHDRLPPNSKPDWTNGTIDVALSSQVIAGTDLALFEKGDAPLRSSCLAVVAAVLSLSGQVRGQSPSPTIDHHQHLFSPSSAALAPGITPVDADALVKLLDIAGIQRAAVLSVAYQFGNPNHPRWRLARFMRRSL